MTHNKHLEHYGRKGMKWGVRKDNGPKLGQSKDAKRAGAAFKKAKFSGVKSLSNKELSDLNNRLGLEQRYSQLNPSAVKRGKNFITSTVGFAGTLASAYAFSRSPLGQSISKKLSRT